MEKWRSRTFVAEEYWRKAMLKGIPVAETPMRNLSLLHVQPIQEGLMAEWLLSSLGHSLKHETRSQLMFLDCLHP